MKLLKKTNLSIIFLIFYILGLVYFYYQNRDITDEFSFRIKLAEKQYNVQKGITDFVLKNEIIENELEGEMMVDTFTFYDLNDNSIKFGEIQKKQKGIKLFFSFTGESCSSCVRAAIDEINNFYSLSDGKISIYIISTFESKKAQLSFINNLKNQKIEVLSFSEKSNLFPHNIINYPFFFIVNESNVIDRVYIHDQMYSNTTIQYLKLLLKKLG